MASTTSGSYAQRIAFCPARRTTSESAVPHAPAPTMPIRWIFPAIANSNPSIRRRPQASRLDASTDRRGCGRVERPARPRRKVELIDEAELQALDAGPCDHCGIVRAKMWWWCQESKAGLACHGFETATECAVRGDTAGDDKDVRIRMAGAECFERVRRPVGEHVGDSTLETRGEIGHILPIEILPADVLPVDVLPAGLGTA